jgi:hypothetical protein
VSEPDEAGNGGMTSESKICLHRGRHILIDKRATYEVLVDGQKFGNLPPEQSLEFPVAPGEHRVQVRFDDTVSREVKVSLQPGERIDLACSTRPGGAWFNPLLLGRPLHLNLKPVDDQKNAPSAA